eukprot:TRINITY_DN1916_c0_g1_i10.p1 TRINITY_DN1916_c0_g1~~TRINITY_DN1916_c0_g1_i10.p1  ORF type:complete len:155 (-),score=2.65 TRINITY_DN1916_c0_g1_i10:236-634(-)
MGRFSSDTKALLLMLFSGILAVGSAARVLTLLLGPKLHYPSDIVTLLVAIFICIASIFGFCGAYRRDGHYMRWFVILLIFLICLTIIGLILDVVYNYSVHSLLWDLFTLFVLLLAMSFAYDLTGEGYQPLLT